MIIALSIITAVNSLLIIFLMRDGFQKYTLFKRHEEFNILAARSIRALLDSEFGDNQPDLSERFRH